MRHYLKNNWKTKKRGMAPVIEFLSSKHTALSSNPSSSTKKNKKNSHIILLYHTLLSICTKEWKSAYMPTHVYSMFIMAKLWNQPRCTSTDKVYNENVVYIHNGVLFSHKEEWDYGIFRKVTETRDHHVKWHKADSERWISHIFSNIWNTDLKK
jgi:hypothetical protein